MLATVQAQADVSVGTVYDLPGPTVPIMEVSNSSAYFEKQGLKRTRHHRLGLTQPEQ